MHSPFSPHAKLITGGTALERLEVANLPLESSTHHLVLQPKEGKVRVSINQIRELKGWLSTKPVEELRKTVFIPEAQQMTVEAQNSLLKTLEEPPEYAQLALTAPNTASLLPTIVSRCAITNLGPRIEIDAQAETHQQAVEDLIQILQAESASASRRIGRTITWSTEHKKELKDRSWAQATAAAWISACRDIILLAQGRGDLILNLQYRNRLAQLTPLITPAWERKMLELSRILKGTNVNRQIALENFLLNLCYG